MVRMVASPRWDASIAPDDYPDPARFSQHRWRRVGGRPGGPRLEAAAHGRGFDTAAPFGREAQVRLASLVLHRWIRLEQEGPAIDTYNRHLAYVMTEDGVCINAALVREGLARISARLPLSRLDEFRRAEAEAQRFRRGMWGGAPSIPAAGYTPRSGAIRSPAPPKKSPAAKRRTTSTTKTKTKTKT